MTEPRVTTALTPNQLDVLQVMNKPVLHRNAPTESRFWWNTEALASELARSDEFHASIGGVLNQLHDKMHVIRRSLDGRWSITSVGQAALALHEAVQPQQDPTDELGEFVLVLEAFHRIADTAWESLPTADDSHAAFEEDRDLVSAALEKLRP